MEDSKQQERFEFKPDIEAAMAAIGKDILGRPDELIGLLQKFQRELGFLPESVLLQISRLTGQTPANIFGVATFYSQFRFQPVGKHIIKVCCGTACHVRRSSRILKEIQSRLHMVPGETTKDGLFTLETVACFGSCALAPVVVVDDIVYGRMSPSKVIAIIDQIIEEAKEPSAHNRDIGELGRSQWTTHL